MHKGNAEKNQIETRIRYCMLIRYGLHSMRPATLTQSSFSDQEYAAEGYVSQRRLRSIAPAPPQAARPLYGWLLLVATQNQRGTRPQQRTHQSKADAEPSAGRSR